ncbi:MAG: zinc metalloprotease HtpX [Candidatus Omnitrophica bacterium]|nr:zinc metalloprotease HtpX [Candidatus Omnitrophota bacterium]
MDAARSAFIKGQNRKFYLCIAGFMAVLTFILGGIGAALSYYFHWGLTGTGVFLLLAGIINFFSYFFSHLLIIKMSRSRALERRQAPEFFDMVDSLCREQGLPSPKLYLINDDAMNAFATGRDKKRAVVAVTRGLLEKLSIGEVRGVVGHELTHIQNNDMRLMTIVTLAAGFISIFADMYWHGVQLSKADEKDRSGVLAIIGFILALFAPLTAMFIQLAISRRREFIADAGSAEMTDDPLALASALEKIRKDMRPLPSAGVTTAHLYFSNPAKSTDLIDKLFSTHPPIEERIRMLKMMKGA